MMYAAADMLFAPARSHDSGSSEPSGRGTTGDQRVLLADDEEDLRETLADLLAHVGYRVTTADSGASAVAAARAHGFDLLLTDLRMPDMDGAETITAIKQIDPTIRVIVITGYSSEEVAADCRRRGADEIVPKPFDIKELLRIMERVVRSRSP